MKTNNFGMKKTNKTQLGIIGSGGFAREVLQLALDIQKNKEVWFKEIYFVELDKYFTTDSVDKIKVLKFSKCDINKMNFVIGIGDPIIKRKVLSELPLEVEFTSLISPSAFLANNFKYKQGLIVMPFSYLSCNVVLGKHVHINSNCSVGHDTKIGDFFTAASSVMIAGNNIIEECCYFGMNSSTKQGVKLSKNIKVGLNSGVIKDLIKPGTYFGIPAKFLI